MAVKRGAFSRCLHFLNAQVNLVRCVYVSLKAVCTSRLYRIPRYNRLIGPRFGETYRWSQAPSHLDHKERPCPSESLQGPQPQARGRVLGAVRFL